MLRARFTHASKTLHAKTPKHLHGSDIHARLAVGGRNDGYVDVVRGRRMERVEAFLTAQHAGNKILGNRRAHVLVDLPGAAPGWGEYGPHAWRRRRVAARPLLLPFYRRLANSLSVLLRLEGTRRPVLVVQGELRPGRLVVRQVERRFAPVGPVTLGGQVVDRVAHGEAARACAVVGGQLLANRADKAVVPLVAHDTKRHRAVVRHLVRLDRGAVLQPAQSCSFF